jgi:cytochrome P450
MTQVKSPDLTSRRFKADPYPFYARLRAEAPVYRTRWVFRLSVWIVTRYDDVLTVLKDERFSKAYISRIPFVPRSIQALAANMLNLDPPDHTRLRTLVSKAFTPRVVEQLRVRIQSVCDELLDAAAADRRMELVRGFALPLSLTIIADLLSIPAVERQQFGSWSRRVVAGDSGRVLEALRAWASMWRFGRYFRDLVARRRGHSQENLVTALIEAEEAGDKLSEEELIAMLGLLLFAGYETTVNLIASGALALVRGAAAD